MIKRLLAACFVGLSLTTHAQQITYEHDAAKMNQFTVQETGVGALTPPVYYQMAHYRYQQVAYIQNKSAYRTSVGLSACQQVEMADSLDASMRSRAKIETLNMTDRQVDLAWSAEQSKIEGKMADLQRNINRIMTVGGKNAHIQFWQMEYNKFTTAIKAIKEGYMPNSQRKKQYLRIYDDLRQANDRLIRQLVYLNGNKTTKKLLAARYVKPDNTKAVLQSALNNWRQSGWSVRPGSADNGPVRPIVPNHPFEPIKPVNPNLPFEPIKPVNPNPPFEPIKPVNPGKPIINNNLQSQ